MRFSSQVLKLGLEVSAGLEVIDEDVAKRAMPCACVYASSNPEYLERGGVVTWLRLSSQILAIIG